MIKSTKIWASFLMAFVFLAVHPRPAVATTFERLSLERLTLLSTHVVTAKARSIESRWDKNRTTIYTRVEFEVEKKLRGELSTEKIALYLPGGTVGDESVIVIGAPQISVDDEVVLMLERVQVSGGELPFEAGEVAFGVIGLSQGVFEISRDPETKMPQAVSSAVPIFLHQAAQVDDLPPGGVRGMPLIELERRVREIAQRENGMLEAQEKEGQAEEGEGVEGQRDEGVEEPKGQPVSKQPDPTLEAQEREGLEETGAGPNDAPEPKGEVDEGEDAEGPGENGVEESALKVDEQDSDRSREAQEVEGQEEQGEGPPEGG